MPIYHQLGRVPRKRHVAFRKDDGSLHYEELVGNQGFTGPSSLLYHLRLPTAVKSVRPIRGLGWVAEPERVVRHRHFRTAGLVAGPSAVLDRVPLLFNADVAISMARPRKEDAFFYRNAQGDEVVFVVRGRGRRSSRPSAICPTGPATTSSSRAGILHRWRLGQAPRAAPRDRERGLRAHAEALPQRARPAHRDGALLRARHPPAGEPRRRTTRPASSRSWSRAATGSWRWSCRTTPSTWWAGTATTTPGPSASTTSSRAWAACTCRRRCTRRSRATAS